MTNDGQLPSDLFMDLDRSGPMPLYHQVASRIEESIRSGAMPPGARLENEIALGERLGLSRPTIRRAIQDLVDKGLLVRRRGIGTQVVHGPVTRKVELTSLYDDLTQGSQQPTTKLLDRSDVPATQAVAEALGVEVGASVVHVLRVRFAEDVPMAVLENYLPPEFADITDEDLRAHGLYQLLRSRGVTMRVAKQRIGARAATDDEAGLLEIEDGDPVLTMSRTAYDASGRAVEYGVHCYRPDRYSFEVTLVDK
ncbi:GntR family transcriptional regulator [Curtobacterium sp. MCPF17_047]|uniref:GntR family transcriptional regulator n=1 Tax=unclassified Curtobacterium TaxID=257496 RepID=UPI000DA9E907|nr:MULTISPECIES: GntR family transcriptional regulator [unclassified Curtobacterium]PZE57966.1 GntR family transcriptional regulator [Curtobacterium sp. MCPF17_001]PZF65835.1 GntR family transcriptional regulator [Curtobacterium sp. MCPF17_047]WIB12012.1 GntR family transcriptional regulator [Curtobacterium sp. MCPF17_052]